MDTDTEILKTLESIEKLLKNSSAFTGGRKLPPSSASKEQQTASQRAGREANKAFKATTANLKDTNSSAQELTKNLLVLNSEVGKTTTGFVSLNSSMTKFMASLTPITVPEAVTTPEQEAPNLKALHSLLSESLTTLIQGQVQTNGFLRAISSSSPDSTIEVTQPIAAEPAKNSPETTKDPLKPVQNIVVPLENIFQRMLKQYAEATTTLGNIATVGENLSKVLQKLTSDFFALSRVGMGSTDNLYALSKNALLSGMSLKEYTEMIDKNITFASRAGTIENFDKIISAADGQLATMGIFGREAREMQASLAQSSTMMGVSQANLTDAIAGQVEVFDKLRKSTNMTAAQFAELVNSISENDQVQKELIGLAPQQRAARRNEMLDIASFGQKLGLTASASKELADALIKQRGETVKNRFEQAGRIRQMTQFLGMGEKGERAAQLTMKGRNRSDGETLELQGIAQSMMEASQRSYDQGSIGTQSTLDYFQETLGSSSFGDIMKASQSASLAQDSGKVNQEAFGQHVGKFGQFVGELLVLTKGFNESIGPAILGAIGAAGAIMFRGPILKALTAVVSKIAPTGAGQTMATTSKGAAPVLASIKNFLTAITSADILAPVKSLPGSIKAAGQSLMGLVPRMIDVGKGAVASAKSLFGVPEMMRKAFNAVQVTNMISGGPVQTLKIMLQEFGATISNGARGAATAVKNGWTVIWGGLQAFTRSFGLASAVIDSVIELFTGEVSMALNPEGGFFNRIGGIVTAFFSAIPNFIIDVLGFVLGPNLTENLQNGFDQFVAVSNAAVKSLFSKVFEGWANIFSWILPDDSPLTKTLKKWADETQDSADSNFKTFDKLAGDSKSTLSSISDSNKKAAEKAEAETTKATSKAVAAQSKFNNVQYGMSLDRDALIADAKTVIGTPQVQTQAEVKPVPVNTSDETKQTSAKNTEAALAALGTPEVLAALNAILGVMRENLVQGQRQVEATEAIAKLNRPTAEFTSAEVYANRLLKQGTV